MSEFYKNTRTGTPLHTYRIPQQIFCRKIISLLIFLFLIPLSACNSPKNTDGAFPADSGGRPLQESGKSYIEVSGICEASESVEIRARVEGYLLEILYDPARQVKKGELLFRIDPRIYQARLNRAKAELAVTEARYQLAEVTLKRQQMAYRAKAVSELALIESKAGLEIAGAAVAVAKAVVEAAELELSYTEIYAPISGKIAHSLVDTGNLVGSGGVRTLLTTIVNDDRVYACFTFRQSDVRLFRQQNREAGTEKAHPVFLGLPDETGYPYQGLVDSIANRMDTESKTLQVRAVFDNPEHHLMAGFSVRIRFPLGK